ncbi:shikimate dehydrogenase [Fictibacillus aquaticus]|uniref:Shikimate dehydrogenase (NADP(+)) n=1 Tax=Fictibacillus aquaticus TaxID=2021314 RepID=A0A235F9N6_9BACL|nr:shikimate dehydrogenase [Fictibacillus aquaticus]OYD57988.1 shikimate dehydrogenase [Fictibacillus aquaticus]
MKKLLLIGNPVEQSLSPEMHNAAAAGLGIPYQYEKRCVQPDQLEKTIMELRNGEYEGANVTIPYKSACIPLLDKVDESAEKIGAVNTIVKEGSKLVGYNTDGTGFVRGLKEISPFPIDQSHILIVGAGGAARGIIAALLSEKALCVTVCNRTESKAMELALEWENVKTVSIEQAEKNLDQYSIIINTTSSGMYPHTEKMPISLGTLKAGTMVSDIIYNPFKTLLLNEAQKRGAIIDNGISMFVYQGALAFEKWTGLFPDVELMKETVVEKLRRKLC